MGKLLIIGGGNMGYAIASGITQEDLYKRSEIIIYEKKKERVNYLRNQKYIAFSDINKITNKHFKNIEAIIIAVKPQDIRDTLITNKNIISKRTLVISIAAGINLKLLAKLLPGKQPLARVMPNTPCQAGEGMSVLTFNKHVSKRHKKIADGIFSSIGKTIVLHEKYFDLVGSINGSGPAYFCYLIESLIKSAMKLGLNEKTATKLVLQTSYGTNILLNNHHIPPHILRKAVTSHKGITEAALKVYNKKKLAEIIHMGVLAAKKRSVELGKT